MSEALENRFRETARKEVASWTRFVPQFRFVQAKLSGADFVRVRVNARDERAEDDCKRKHVHRLVVVLSTKPAT